MKNVLVLMSTYNGERYIQEQIDSVLAQQGVNARILVRDDGSTDSTIDILRKFQAQGKLDLICGENIGWRKSFMELIYVAPRSDYYAFCDQDDIWLSRKLSVAINTLQKEDNGIPLMYGSNLWCYKNGQKEDLLRLNPNFSKQTCLVRALTCGCTLVFNEQLLTLLKYNRPTYIEAHDSWVFIVAMYFGKVIYDPNAYVLYRQHEDNQIGANKTLSYRLKRFWNSIFKTQKERSKSIAAQEFLRVFNNSLSENDKLIVSKFANYNTGFVSKMRLLIDGSYSVGGGLSKLLLKLRILIGAI